MTESTTRLCHILVADDEPHIGRIIKMKLEQGPFRVSLAYDGQEALDFVNSGEQLDLVLLDLMMPVMDGFTFLNMIRADPRYERLRVVVVTAKELTPEETEQLRQQTPHVLQKADAFGEELKRLLRTLLQAAPPRPAAVPMPGNDL